MGIFGGLFGGLSSRPTLDAQEQMMNQMLAQQAAIRNPIHLANMLGAAGLLDHRGQPFDGEQGAITYVHEWTPFGLGIALRAFNRRPR